MTTEITLDLLAVEEALICIAEAKAIPNTNPLRSCWLTIHLLQSPRYPKGDYAVLYAIHQIVEESFLSVLESDVKCIRRICLHHFDPQKPYLLAHQLLYFRYMRPELGLTTETLAEIVGFTARTIRRRLQEGLQHLTLDIVRREIVARQTVPLRTSP